MGVQRITRTINNERIVKQTFDAINGISYTHEDNHKIIFSSLAEVFKGNELMLVGGYNRDLIKGDIPHDLDFATNATPDVIISLLKKCADKNEKGEPIVWELGAKFGTIAAKVNGEDIEVTTYRVNEKYSDNSRHPEVEWGKTFEEDAARRDFTINAIGYDVINDEFADVFDGVNDIKNKVIRAVGNPRERFTEDPLRILRAARLAAQLNYTIEDETYKAMKHCAPLIAQLSAERKREEMTKLLSTNKPEHGVDLLVQSYGMEYIIPEIMDMIGMEQPTQYHDKDVYGHTLKVVANVANEPRLRWAALLHDVGKPNTYSITENGVIHYFGHQDEGAKMAYSILKELKFSSEDTAAICHLVRQHMNAHRLTKGLKKEGVNVKKTTHRKDEEGISEKTVEKFINTLDYWKNFNGEDKLLVSAEDVLKLNYADIMGGAPKRVAAGLKNFEVTKKMVEEARARRNSGKPRLPINGNDLMKKFNLKPGPDLGKTISYLTDKMMAGEIKETEADKAYSLAKKYLISALGHKIVDSPINGDEIMKEFNVGPGKYLGNVLKELRSMVENGTMDVTDKEKALKYAKSFLKKNKVI